MSPTDLIIPSCRQMLTALSTWLDKAALHLPAAETEALLSARLAPDMYPLSSQIRFACLQAQEAVYRLRGTPLPEVLEQIAREGREADAQPGALSDARARIAETLTLLDSLDAGALDAGAGRLLTLELPNGMVLDMTGEAYARDWLLPQFYFHLMTAYAILRGQGIALGKADYVPHVLAYVRPGTLPTG